MATTSAVVKKTARAALKDNWLEAIVIGAILIFASLTVYIAVSFLSYVLPSVAVYVIMAALIVFLLLPLFLGVLRCYWKMMWDIKGTIGSVFYYFSSRESYLRAIKLFLTLFLKAAWIGILLLIPSIITDIFSSVKVYELLQLSTPAWAPNLWVVSVFLKVAAGVILTVIMLKFYLAPFLIIADEQMDAHEAIHKSTLLSRASAIDFVILVLSFLGWIILSVFMLPLLVTMPYFLVSYMVHSRFSVASYNKVVKQMNEDRQEYNFSVEGF